MLQCSDRGFVAQSKNRRNILQMRFSSDLTGVHWIIGFSLLLLWCASVLAESSDPRTLVDAALQKLDATNLDDDWYFTMEVTEKDELRIVRSDPLRAKYDRRQLVTVNGAPPDKQQLEKFHDTEVERIDGEDPETRGYRYLVDSQTLQPTESGEGYIKLTFAPRVKALEKSRDKVRGTLMYNTISQQIDEIELLNTEPLSPAFSVTVDTYRLTLQFRQEQGENLLSKLESHAVGTVGFVKGFDSLVKVSVGDYQRAPR
jgi:hypothetical protein